MSTSSIKTVVSDRFEVGESPVWDAEKQRLFWTDIPKGIIHCLDIADGSRQQWEMGEAAGSLGLCASGRLVVALVADVIVFDPTNGNRRKIASVTHAKPGMRLNDGKVGPDGAFWVGSMDASGDANPAGVLYRVAANGQVGIDVKGLRTSNGLAWDSTGTRMYHSDSRGQWIDILDFNPATGEASNRRRWLDIDEATGRPDGGACDLEGNYWSAGPSASRVNCFSPDGQLIQSVDLPNVRPTMPCFGGPDRKTVYVTSLSGGIDDEQRARFPLWGAIVSFEAPFTGVPVARFADE